VKRCQTCGETYADSTNFCDVDGQLLVSAVPSRGMEPAVPAPTPTMGQFWLAAVVGAMAGIVLCLAVYAVYSLAQVQSTQQTEQKPFAASAQEQPRRVAAVPAQPSEPAPVESPSPDEEPTVEASKVQSQSAPETVEANLDRGPISTGQKVKSEEKTSIQTVIVMNDGSSVEVDAAWQDSEGVWYRRGGVVSFIDRQRVKAITARAEPKKGSTDSQ
jgi:hypothetical protein